MKKLLLSAALFAAITAPAFAFDGSSMTFGNGNFSTFNGTDSSGQSVNGSAMRFGNGFTTYNWNDFTGSHTGSSMTFGNGFTTFNGN